MKNQILLLAILAMFTVHSRRHKTKKHHKKSKDTGLRTFEIFHCEILEASKKVHDLFGQAAEAKGMGLGEKFCVYMTVEDPKKVIPGDPCISLVRNMQKSRDLTVEGQTIEAKAYDYGDEVEGEILRQVISGSESFKSTAEDTDWNLAVRAVTVKNCEHGMVGKINIGEYKLGQPIITSLQDSGIFDGIQGITAFSKKRMMKQRKNRKNIH